MVESVHNKRIDEQLKYQYTNDENNDYWHEKIYTLAHLKYICKKFNYKLEITDFEIKVYPIKDKQIAPNISYIEEILDSFVSDTKEESLNLAIDYVCKEILQTKSNKDKQEVLKIDEI